MRSTHTSDCIAISRWNQFARITSNIDFNSMCYIWLSTSHCHPWNIYWPNVRPKSRSFRGALLVAPSPGCRPRFHVARFGRRLLRIPVFAMGRLLLMAMTLQCCQGSQWMRTSMLGYAWILMKKDGKGLHCLCLILDTRSGPAVYFLCKFQKIVLRCFCLKNVVMRCNQMYTTNYGM